MSVSVEPCDEGRGLRIRVEGRFDFSAHRAFLAAFEQSEDVQHFEVDLAQASYLDSAALGMLLLLRDHAGGDDARIEIVGSNPDVKKILAISNFEQLFTIH